MRKIKKGFSLTELIVVIAIIGILAAVLFPSITGFIKKAKVAKGVAEAGSMNVILAAESIYQERDYFEPYEVTRILKENSFSLTSALNDYRFWYDASENKVKFIPFEQVFGEVSAANNTFTQDCIEALSSTHPEYRYVDSYSDEITEIISTVRHLPEKAKDELSYSQTEDFSSDSEKKQSVLDKMNELFDASVEKLNKIKQKGISSSNKTSIINYAHTFNTTDSVYIDNYVMYNSAYLSTKDNLTVLANNKSNVSVFGSTVSLEISHMIFSEEITKVPEVNSVSKNEGVTFEVIVTTPFEIPDTVTTVKSGSFTNITLCAGITIKDTALLDETALSEAAQDALIKRTSNVAFITLFLGTDFTISYNKSEAKLNDGTTASYTAKDNSVIDLTSLVNTDYQSSKEVVSQYLVPSINFTNNKIDYAKVKKVVIRRSLQENICTYSAIMVDEDLKCFKVENFGYVSDIDWSIDQKFSYTNNTAVVKVTLPAYVYNFSNFKGAKMEVEVLPQIMISKDVQATSGLITVFDGIALASEPIVFRIEDGIYDSQTNTYVYEHTMENLSQYSIKYTSNGTQITGSCNQISINKISMFTEDSNSTNDNVLFVRYYE